MKEKKIHDPTSMHEVAIVYKRPLFDTMPHITNSEDVNSIIKEVVDLNTLDLKEFFWVLLLNNGNRVLGIAEIGRGDTKAVTVNVKEIFQLVIKTNAVGLVLCHNHPSGILKPSEADKAMTKKIKEASKLFSVSLLDHVIITSEDYYSFVDGGLI